MELIKALKIAFPSAVLLRCVNHIRNNIKDKCNALKLPLSVQKEITGDIFGTQVGATFESGLIDAKSAAVFRKALSQLKEQWNNLEKSSTPQFFEWFCCYTADDICNCVRPYTTNNNESTDHVLKQEVQWKETKLPVLINTTFERYC